MSGLIWITRHHGEVTAEAADTLSSQEEPECNTQDKEREDPKKKKTKTKQNKLMSQKHKYEMEEWTVAAEESVSGESFQIFLRPV